MIKRMISFVSSLIPALLFSFIFGLVAEFLQVVVAWYTGKILTQSAFSWTKFWLIIIFIIIGGLSAFAEQYSGHYVAFKILAKIRNLVYQKIQRLSPTGLEKKYSANLLKMIGSDIEAMEIFYAHTIVPLFIGIFFLISVSIIFSIYAPFAGIIYFFFSIVIGVFLPLFKVKEISANNGKLALIQGKIQQLMFEIIRGRDILEQLNASQTKISDVKSNYQNEAQINQSVGILNFQKNWLKLSIIIVAWLTTAGGLIILNYPLKTILPILLSFPFAFKPVESLASLSDPLSKGLDAANRIFDLLDTPETKLTDGSFKIKQIKHLEIKNLNFKYSDREVQILQNVNLSIKQGEIGGIIGASGSGKSTLVKLIMNWYLVSDNSIFINDTDINNIDRQTLWKQINFLTQEPQLFSDTIRQNLTLGDESIDDEEIWNILNEVQLADLVSKLPKGLNQEIGATNLQLSAGESQRLVLARALIYPSSLLILDEPTSNLDVLNEKIILYAIKKYYKGIVIIITHREESLGVCDWIWKISNGKIQIIKDKS